ncbi:MAG: oligosaccharide flippase family protein, partial [Pyrinomonadaceae bacterium]
MSDAGETTQSLRSQSAWLLAAKVIGFGFSFVLPLLIVRYLAKDAVGTYREAFQVIANAIVILPLGFSMSAYYFLARETERRGAAILNILVFNFVVGGLACLVLQLYPQMIGGIFRSNELTALTPMIGVVIWIWIFSTFLETVAIANQEARVATGFIILAQFSKTLLMGTAVFAFATVEAFIYAAMIQGVIQTAILFWYLRSRFPGFWLKFDAGFFWEQMRYALPFGLAGILW